MIVVAVVLGKPLSYMSCTNLSTLGDHDASAYVFSSHLDSYLSSLSKKIDFNAWIGASKAICLENKAIWGLSIALWYVVSRSLLRNPENLIVRLIIEQYPIFLFDYLQSVPLAPEEGPRCYRGEVMSYTFR